MLKSRNKAKFTAIIIGVVSFIGITPADAAQDVISNLPTYYQNGITPADAAYNTSDFTSTSGIPTLGVVISRGIIPYYVTPTADVFVIVKGDFGGFEVYSDQESFTVQLTPSSNLLASTGALTAIGGSNSGPVVISRSGDLFPNTAVACEDLTITTTNSDSADTTAAATNTITIRITVLETTTSTVPACASLVAPSSSQSSSSTDIAALAAAEAKRKAEIVAAKSSLLADIKAIKSPTLAEYRAADYGVTQQATVDRINTQVLELQAKTPTIALTEAQILPVVQKESFVEYVSTDVTQGRVNSRQLIDNAIITSDYKFRASVLRAIKNASVADLNTYAKIKAVADAEIASIQARKDRLEAIIKKISGLK